MKLEHGRYYATADGRRLGPASLEGERRGVEGRWSMSGHDYDDDGHATSGPSDVNDAVEPWAAGTNKTKITALDRPEEALHWIEPKATPPLQFTKAPSVEELIGAPDEVGTAINLLGLKFVPAASWQPTAGLRYAPKLQQLWVETFSGKTEWRDVPREAK